MGHHGNSFISFGAEAAVGGWVELDRTTLGSAGDTIDVTSLADKRYYMVLTDKIGTANSTPAIRLNSDGSTNYATRESSNGAADATAVSGTHAGTSIPATGLPAFVVQYIANLSAEEKLIQGWGVNQNTAGAANAPTRRERVSKWVNTSDTIDEITQFNPDTGNFSIGAQVVVLGWDPADVHTTNFWEELASVSGDGTSTTLTSGTITAKKYLWTQLYTDESTSAVMRFNSDSGTNYARRGSVNGAADFTVANATGSSNLPSSNEAFGNCFIINNSANEKLAISHAIDQNTAGAANGPTRKEETFKWTNTSTQITNISWIKTGNWSSQAILKVWGSN